MQHVALQKIFNFKQLEDEKLPKARGRFCATLKGRPDHGMPKNELIDIFYNRITIESRTYLDSCAGCIYRERTVEEAEELLGNIAKNHDDWDIPEPMLTP